MGDFQSTYSAWLDDAQVEVRYDYQPAEPTIYNPPDKARQGCDAEVTITRLCINGEWVSPKHLSKAWIGHVESEILTEIAA